MPTIRRCCIVGCMSNSRQNPQLQFFQFPRPENPFHKLWKQACQASLSRILPFKKPVVCALHFRPNCIGGRRLTSSAVPSLRLEVPQNLKAVEQQAMIEEIERSRKCAYINAVVYEWLVRANLNPQLRGSITHGMIKEKAESARQIIGSSSFIADNRWLNRFRETHLTGFAQKLSSNQLKPVGSSLWIPDIVQDLQHMFPPTNADRIKLEGVPDQYYDYMQQQYGEYDEDDDSDQKSNLSISIHDQSLMSNHYIQPDQRQQQQSPHAYGNYEPYGHVPYAGGYDDYYYQQQQDRKPQPHQQAYQHQHQSQQHNSYHHTPPPHTPPIGSPNLQHITRTPSQSPHQQQQQTTSPPSPPPPPPPPPSQPSQQQSSSSPSLNDPIAASATCTRKCSESPNSAKRARYDDDDNDKDRIENESIDNDNKQNDNGSEPSRRSSSSSDNDNENENDNVISANENANSNGNDDRNGSNYTSAPSSPLTSLGGQNGHTIRPIHISKITQPRTNGNTTASLTNGHVTPTPTSKQQSNGIYQDQIPRNKRVELQTYAQALEYLKPLEDFVLFKENFRAIGVISHLEAVLRKARNRCNQPEIKGEN